MPPLIYKVYWRSICIKKEEDLVVEKAVTIPNLGTFGNVRCMPLLISHGSQNADFVPAAVSEVLAASCFLVETCPFLSEADPCFQLPAALNSCGSLADDSRPLLLTLERIHAIRILRGHFKDLFKYLPLLAMKCS